MKNQSTILMILLLLMVGACTPILKWIKHVKDPKIETKETVISFLTKKNKDYPKHLFVLRDSAAFFTILSAGMSIPEAVFFNSKGEVLKYSDDGCPGKAMDFAKNLMPGQPITVDPVFKWDFIGTRIIACGSDSIFRIDAHNYTMVVFWAIWGGNVNNNVFEIVEELKKRPELDVQTIFVNMDVLESWNIKGPLKVKQG